MRFWCNINFVQLLKLHIRSKDIVKGDFNEGIGPTGETLVEKNIKQMLEYDHISNVKSRIKSTLACY